MYYYIFYDYYIYYIFYILLYKLYIIFTVVRISSFEGTILTNRQQSRSLMCVGDNEEDRIAGDNFSGCVAQLIRNGKSGTVSCTLLIQPAIVSPAVK